MPELVALALPGGPAFVDALRSVWDRGDAVLPLDDRLPDTAVAALLNELRPGRILDGGGERTLPRGAPTEAGDALVMATSGTTGAPKGVVLTHDAVAASSAATSGHLHVDPTRHHWLACLPLAHIGGMSVVTRALWSGTALTVHRRFDADSAVAAARAGATHVSLVATALGRIDPAVFDCVVVGGSAPPRVPAPNVTCTYGLTETASGVVYDGWPLRGVEVRATDGELWVRGPMLLRCYRDGSDRRDANGWFPTGDGGAVDPVTGFVTVHGRQGDVIVTGGQKVWPEPVERIVARFPGVADVVVVGRPDPEWGHAVTAVVVPRRGLVPPALEALRDAVKAELAPYCAPRRVELAGGLPRTALGKVRRSAV